MPTYRVSGQDAAGRERFVRVEADSGDAAVFVAERDGLFDAVLHTDDIQAQLHALFPLEQRKSVEQMLTAAEEHAYFATTPWQATLLTMKLAARKLWWALAGFGVWLGWRVEAGGHWTLIDVLVPGTLVWVLVTMLLGQRPSFWYDRLLRAAVWARWDEVLEMVERLENSRSGVPAFELEVRRAQAFAGKGDLAGGLALLARLRPEVSPELYWSRRASIHAVAGDAAATLEALEQAVAAAPENPILWIDLANGIMHHAPDPARARAAVEHAEAHVLAPLAHTCLLIVRGQLALEDGDHGRSKDLLLQALEELELLRAVPVVDTIIANVLAYLTVVHARLGEREAAEACFDEAEPLLEAGRDDRWLRRCREVLSDFAESPGRRRGTVDLASAR